MYTYINVILVVTKISSYTYTGRKLKRKIIIMIQMMSVRKINLKLNIIPFNLMK